MQAAKRATAGRSPAASDAVRVPVQVLPHGEGLALPAYMSPDAAGMDLRAAVEEALVVRPGERVLVPAGLKVAVPPGYEAQIRPRSGLAIRHGITLLNSPGTIDADYRGEVQVILANLGHEPFTVNRGDRIAQMVVSAVARATLEATDELPPTGRGEGGFGHTGV